MLRWCLLRFILSQTCPYFILGSQAHNLNLNLLLWYMIRWEDFLVKSWQVKTLANEGAAYIYNDLTGEVCSKDFIHWGLFLGIVPLWLRFWTSDPEVCSDDPEKQVLFTSQQLGKLISAFKINLVLKTSNGGPVNISIKYRNLEQKTVLEELTRQQLWRERNRQGFRSGSIFNLIAKDGKSALFTWFCLFIMATSQQGTVNLHCNRLCGGGGGGENGVSYCRLSAIIE